VKRADQNAPDRHKDGGYTLTELLVVIVVLAMVAAAVTPQVFNRFSSAQSRSAMLQANTLSAALDEFFLDVGRYPTPEEGVAALLEQPATAPGWRGPYVRSGRNLEDPWGRRFLLRTAAAGHPPSVVSLGADGAEGGDGVNADIVFP
jgi:general secretion pathway protein G